MHGQFVWYDLMTSDPSAAQRFYTSLTGWKTQRFEHSPDDNPYTMWVNNGTALGGVAGLSREMVAMGVPPHWLSSVKVNSVDETVRKATAGGGKLVMGPMDIPETGRFAVLEDPFGSTIGVFQPSGDQPGFDGDADVGRHSWNELMTTDYKRAFDFYRGLFGWDKIDEMDVGDGMTYLMFGHGSKMYGGMYDRPAEMGMVPPFWLPYIKVRDAKQSGDAAVRLGGRVMRGPMQVPGGDWIVILQDPQGAAFAIHSAAAAAPQPQKRASGSKSTRKAKRAAKSGRSAAARKPKRGAKSGKGAVRKAKRGKTAARKAKRAAKRGRGVARKTRRTAKPKTRGQSRRATRKSAKRGGRKARRR